MLMNVKQNDIWVYSSKISEHPAQYPDSIILNDNVDIVICRCANIIE